jgi:glycosyltransferase involved in cell wall biosynthesis
MVNMVAQPPPSPVLFVDHAPALGGAEHSLLSILEYLDRTHWQPHLAGVKGHLLDKALELDIPVYGVPLKRLRRSPFVLMDWYKGVHALRMLAHELNATALYANTVRAAFYAAPAARLAGCLFIWHMRDFWLTEKQPSYFWLDRLGKRALCVAATLVIANSYAVATHLPCRSSVTLVYNGLNLASFDPRTDGTSFRQHYDISPDVSLVGMVGRLRPWKGQERFLYMAAKVLSARPKTHFVLVGGDPFGLEDDYGKRLQQTLHQLNLSGHVTFTGQLSDVRPALAAMDVFVHPGDPEPFGLVNIEAMAMEKPVVAFAHGALPEIVIDGRTGLLVEPGNNKALADGVICLLDDRARRVALGQQGRERAGQMFRIEQTVEKVEQVLSNIIVHNRRS